MRLMHTNSFCSLVIFISQTCVFFPTWTGLVMPVTKPSRTLLMWLAFISSPTQYCLLISMQQVAATLPNVSASDTEAPPCKSPIGWCVR
jgi:hypothetical protein